MAKMRGSDKETRDLLAYVTRLGWRVEGGGMHHYKLFPPDGAPMQVVSASPSAKDSTKSAWNRIHKWERTTGAARD